MGKASGGAKHTYPGGIYALKGRPKKGVIRSGFTYNPDGTYIQKTVIAMTKFTS